MPQNTTAPTALGGRLFSAPTYERIEDDLRARILANDWPAGGRIPSRKELAEEYRVSVPTVQRAIADLLADGLLSADRGRGTFVGDGAAQAAPSPSKSIAHPRRDARRRGAAKPSARLKPGVAATIGVIADLPPSEGPATASGYWPEIIARSLERTITAEGGMTRFFNLWRPDWMRADMAEAVAALRSEGVDAFAVLFVSEAEAQRICRASPSDTPVVFVDSVKAIPSTRSVYYDSWDEGYQAAEHLLQAGCADLLYFSPYSYRWVSDRLAGAREAVRRHGLPPGALQAAVGERNLHDVLDPIAEDPLSHMKAGYAAARLLLAEGGLPARGVIGTNDHVALGFRQAAEEAGLLAGRDYALIGFDDQPGARAAGLSTLHPPLEALGQEAGRLLLHTLAGETTPMQVCLHSYLVARASSRLRG